jgi:hypothetical protein
MDAQPAALAASGRPPDPQRPAPPGPAPGRPPSMLGRVAPVAGLFLLAPLVGEYLLGNASIVELPALPILALLCGSGAILVRELARRTGRGWPTMLGLGLAYGLLEAGPIDQTCSTRPGRPMPGQAEPQAAVVAADVDAGQGVAVAGREDAARGHAERRRVPGLPDRLADRGGVVPVGVGEQARGGQPGPLEVGRHPGRLAGQLGRVDLDEGPMGAGVPADLQARAGQRLQAGDAGCRAGGGSGPGHAVGLDDRVAGQVGDGVVAQHTEGAGAGDPPASARPRQ